MTNESIIHTNLHKSNNKLVSALLEHFWCTDQPWAYIDSQDSPRPEFGGSHHLSPYNILCDQSQGLHPNVILSQDSQLGSFEIPKIGIFDILEGHNFLCIPQIQVKFKAKLQALWRDFQGYVTCHLNAFITGRFSTFSWRESNWHFDSPPFFWP